MANLNIGGFEFPNSLNAQCAITKACKFLIENGPCDMTTMREFALKPYYSHHSIRLGALNHTWVEYPENHEYFKESAINLLWTRKKEGRSYQYYPTQHTQTAANLWESLQKEYDNKNNKNLENKFKKLQRLLEKSNELKIGDIIVTNLIEGSFHLFLHQQGQHSSRFEEHPYGGWNTHMSVEPNKQGIIIGEMEVPLSEYNYELKKFVEYSTTSVFIVMHNGESEPMYYPKLALKKIKK